MFFGVTCPSGSSDPGCAGDEFAGACGVVVRSGLEAFRVCGVEAVAGGQTGDSGEDEAVTCLYHHLYGWGGFVAFRGGACSMGWVGRWGVVGADLRPHALLQREFPVLSGECLLDVLLVPPEFCLRIRPGPIPFASPEGKGISGGGV
jgi:hypothetical protein